MKKVVSTVGVVALSLSLVALAAGSSGKTHQVSATLKAATDVPKPKGAAGATGSFSGTYVENANNTAVLKWKLTFKSLTGPALQAHIHLGKPGVAGNVLVPLCAPCKNGMTGTSKLSHSIANSLHSGGTYVNVHTKKNPAGEIRGQIKVTD